MKRANELQCQALSRLAGAHGPPSRLHLVAVATPPAFTGDGLPAAGEFDMDVSVAGGAFFGFLART
jgi:hypothetical protein